MGNVVLPLVNEKVIYFIGNGLALNTQWVELYNSAVKSYIIENVTGL